MKNIFNSSNHILFAPLLALCCGAAQAQLVPPDLSAIPLTSFTLNQWYVIGTRAVTSTQVDLLNDVSSSNWGTNATSASYLHNSNLDKFATAQASASPVALGAIANSNISTLDDTLSAGLAQVAVMYGAVLDTPGTVTLDFHLTGRLLVNGERPFFFPDPSRAGVAAYALGSYPGANTPSLFSAAGIDLTTQGQELAWLTQLVNWPTTTQPNLVTFGQMLDSPVTDPIAYVDTTLSVSSSAQQVECPAGLVSNLCGKYMYAFWGFMAVGAENGADADFSHTLSAAALHLPNGATMNFLPGQEIPVVGSVPEPQSGGMFLAGAGMLAWLRQRRQRPS